MLFVYDRIYVFCEPVEVEHAHDGCTLIKTHSKCVVVNVAACQQSSDVADRFVMSHCLFVSLDWATGYTGLSACTME